MLRLFSQGNNSKDVQRPTKIQKTNAQDISGFKSKPELLTKAELALCDAIKSGNYIHAQQLTWLPDKPNFKRISNYFNNVLFAYLRGHPQILTSILDAYFHEISTAEKIKLAVMYHQSKWHTGPMIIFKSLGYPECPGLIVSFAKLAEAKIYYDENIFIYQFILSASGKYHITNLTDGIVRLYKAGIYPNEYPWLYQALYDKSFHAAALAENFIKLFNVNIPYKGNELIYHALYKCNNMSIEPATYIISLIHSILPNKVSLDVFEFVAYHPEATFDTIEAFLLLANDEIEYEENGEIYQLILKCSKNCISLATAFAILNSHHVSYHGHEGLYLAIAESDTKIQTTGAFLILHEDVPYVGHEEMYQLLFNIQWAMEDVAECFLKLIKENILYHDYKDVFKALSSTNGDIDDMTLCYIHLIKQEISLQGKEKLLKHIEPESLLKLFESLERIGVNINNAPQHMTINLLVVNHKIALYALETLVKFGFSPLHSAVFDSLLAHLNNSICNYAVVGNMIKRISSYANNNTLILKEGVARDEQIQSLLNIINACDANLGYLTFGPLNQSHGTKTVEMLLNKIVNIDIQSHDLIFFNDLEQYILMLPGSKPVNLSVLLRNANLSQLYLENALIEKIGRIIARFAPEESEATSNDIVKLLHPIQQIAIKHYIGEKYININRFFRSEALSNSKRKSLHRNPSINMTLNFLLGCLLNDAVNKLHWLPDHYLEEKKLLNLIAADANLWISDFAENPEGLTDLIESHNPEKSGNNKPLLNKDQFNHLSKCTPKTLLSLYKIKHPLCRGEVLDEEHIKERLANPYCFPALTSFSAKKKGVSSFFGETGSIKTSLENAANFYIIGSDEKEVLIAHGEQIITTQGPEGLISTLVRSPSLIRNHLISDSALLHAFQFYLSKAYKEDPISSITIDNTLIHRPNHNAPHTYRVMLVIECVVQYFSCFTNDPAFKLFCQSLRAIDIEFLKTLAAFSVTGRESEISASEDLQKYDRYREACANHLIAFTDQFCNITQKHKDMFWHVIRYMGNPDYEAKINDNLDEQYKAQHRFIYRIITLAHKLDLPRCYDTEDFQRSLETCCDDLSEKSPEQQEALNDILRYMIDLMKVHGSTLMCDIKSDGSLFDVDTCYQTVFARVSTSINQLFKISQTVSMPSFDTDNLTITRKSP